MEGTHSTIELEEARGRSKSGTV